MSLSQQVIAASEAFVASTCVPHSSHSYRLPSWIVTVIPPLVYAPFTHSGMLRYFCAIWSPWQVRDPSPPFVTTTSTPQDAHPYRLPI